MLHLKRVALAALAAGLCPHCAGLHTAVPGVVPRAADPPRALRGGGAQAVARTTSFRLRPADTPQAAAETFTAHERGLAVMLVKALMGSSCLNLAGALAGFSNSKTSLFPGLTLTMGLALLAGYTYCLVGTCCDEMGVEGYTQLWSTTISASSAWIPTTFCAAFAAIACQVCPHAARARRAAFEFGKQPAAP
jgi:hypothetical protein